jgi:hypothetical protein
MSSVIIAGNTSGTITLDAPAVAGTTTLTLPTNTGNIPVVTGTGTSGQVLTSGGSGAVSTWTTISTTPTTAQVQTATAGSSEGDLGTYAFLYQPSGGYTQGATAAGSSLNWISLYASSLGGATAFTNTVNATTLSGTWKAMNKGNYSGSGAIGVWLRIA